MTVVAAVLLTGALLPTALTTLYGHPLDRLAGLLLAGPLVHSGSVLGLQMSSDCRLLLATVHRAAAKSFGVQLWDAQTGRLYIAHLADDMLTVFDVKTQKVVGDVKDLKRVHGVIAVPELHRIYASATGTQ